MADVRMLHAAAARHHRAGRLAEAETAYRQILGADPGNAVAFHGLGLIALALDHPKPALSLMEEAVRADPKNGDFLVDLAVARAMNGRTAEAADAFARAVECAPGDLNIRYNYGLFLYNNGLFDPAVAQLVLVVEHAPDRAPAWLNLGLAHLRAGRADEAMTCLTRCVAIDPADSGARLNLANLLLETGDADGAAREYRAVLAKNVRQADALYGLGNALKQLGDIDEAIASFRRALAVRPDFVPALNNLGVALQNRANKDEALAVLGKVVTLAPDEPSFHHNLAKALVRYGEWDAAEARFTEAIRIDPAYAPVQCDFATLLQNTARVGEAVDRYRALLMREPENDLARGCLLMALNYAAEDDNAEIYRESASWGKVAAASRGSAAFPNRADPARRLRIGYVSPDFRSHSVSFFFEPLLAAHSAAAVETFCYSNSRFVDAVTERLHGAAAHWRSITDVDAVCAAEMVRADGIDILVDLAGHTADNRLDIFARKSAPIQATWLGYPNTSGLATIDYRLTDDVADPPGIADARHVEKLVRVPGGFLCYRPPADAPHPAEPPVLTRGHVTFGSFNTLAKLSPRTIEIWAAVLTAVPGARLLLKSAALASRATAERLRGRFATYGISPGRLDFAAHVATQAGHLEHYAHVDIALDPFPYNGTTTTFEALWMGVPVIALNGARHAGRVGASILTHAGFPELVATDLAGYVDLARTLAADRDRLVGLRRALRPGLARSPLCDAASFARRMEAVYRDLWRTWCAAPERKGLI